MSLNESLESLFLDAMGQGAERAIERQEARGQEQLVGSDLLPTDCPKDVKTALEAAGVVFGEVVSGDALFRHVSLPTGWKKVATDHAMWSTLVDDTGRERAKIFYKAAFYDRRAFLQSS